MALPIRRLTSRPVVKAFLRGEVRNGLSSFVKNRTRDHREQRLLSSKHSNWGDIEAFIAGHPEPLNAPLAMISQVQRSGGSLLSQLFDGHPQLAAHPHELKFGYPTDEDWPPIDPALGADRNFRLLFDAKITDMVRDGYTKGKNSAEAPRERFIYVPRIHYAVFDRLFQDRKPRTEREILDIYFTGYFNAWLNHQGSIGTTTSWLTAFAPCFAHHEANVAKFFDAYPDGQIIQVLRNPASWYPSAKRHRKAAWKKKPVEEILDLWSVSARSMIRNKTHYGSRVLILDFDQLVSQTEAVMSMFADRLGIGFSSVLLEPTFNGQPIGANSSFEAAPSGVIAAPIARAETLTDEERDLIGRRCGVLHQQARDLVTYAAESGRSFGT
jgi:hypothetical protein